MDKKNLKLGLTGGIGCGKSTVLKIFESLGCLTIDTDLICHDIYNNNNEFKNLVLKRWGNSIIDKYEKIIRKKIAKIVFRDKNELEWLNNSIHPLISNEVERKVSEASSDFNIIIYDVPLLYEVKWEKMFSSIISVWAPLHTQIERLKARNWTIDEINSRLKSQYSVDLKLELSDYGIINSGSIELLKQQCKYILSKFKR